jgi:hypothetical protein
MLVIVITTACHVLQGSALDRIITSSITRIENNSPTGLQELGDIVEEWGSSFDFIHTSAAFSKAAKLQHPGSSTTKSLLDTLAGMWDGQLPDAKPREIANLLWACGKLRYNEPHLWSSTLAAYTELLQDSSHNIPCQELSNVLYGMAVVALSNKGKVPGVSRAATEAAVCQVAERVRIHVTHPLLEGVNPQAVSNSLWACVKLRINPGDAALNSMLQAMARPTMLEAAAPQSLGNTLWATSELRQHCSWQPSVQQRVWDRLLGEQPLKLVAKHGTHIEVSNTIQYYLQD